MFWFLRLSFLCLLALLPLAGGCLAQSYGQLDGNTSHCGDLLLDVKLMQYQQINGQRQYGAVTGWDANVEEPVAALPDSIDIYLTVHLRNFVQNPGLPRAAAPNGELLLTGNLGFEGGTLPDCHFVVNPKSFSGEKLFSRNINFDQFFRNGQYAPLQTKHSFPIRSFWKSYSTHLYYFLTHIVINASAISNQGTCLYESRVGVCR